MTHIGKLIREVLAELLPHRKPRHRQVPRPSVDRFWRDESGVWVYLHPHEAFTSDDLFEGEVLLEIER